MISILDKFIFVLFENNEMKEHFKKRTIFHITLVRKYLIKMINLNDPRLSIKVLEHENQQHDKTKFENPEYEPYLHVNWKYKLKDEGIKYDPPKEILDKMNEATLHHITTNTHHPEFWDRNFNSETNFDPINRDEVPEKIVDATEMPLSNIACMVADWLAMSEEKNTNPYDWAEKNINKRWKFTKEQVDLIYSLLRRLWGN